MLIHRATCEHSVQTVPRGKSTPRIFLKKKFILREDRERRNFFDVGEIFFFC